MAFNLEKFFAGGTERVNAQGNKQTHVFVPTGMDLPGSTRYAFDFNMPEGWFQYDTEQDASYFGVWYNPEAMQTVTFAEGDWYWVQCADADAWKREIDNMAEFYGDPPPFATTIDADGTVTRYVDSEARP